MSTPNDNLIQSASAWVKTLENVLKILHNGKHKRTAECSTLKCLACKEFAAHSSVVFTLINGNPLLPHSDAEDFRDFFWRPVYSYDNSVPGARPGVYNRIDWELVRAGYTPGRKSNEIPPRPNTVILNGQ